MAAKGVFSLVFVFACVATSQVYGKATDPPTTDPPTTPHCECINPFTETEPDKAYRWLKKIQTAKLLLCGRKMYAKITKKFVNLFIRHKFWRKISPRGDPDTLCGPKGPGVCYVDCNADCRDIEPTASASRLLLNLIDIFFQTCNDIIWNRFMFIIIIYSGANLP